VSDALQTAIISGAVTIIVAIIGARSHRQGRRDARREQPAAEAGAVPPWVFPAIIIAALGVVLGQAFAPLLVPDRHVDVPPLLYLLGAGAVIYYVALVLSRRRP
jgi:hypothetical protein